MAGTITRQELQTYKNNLQKLKLFATEHQVDAEESLNYFQTELTHIKALLRWREKGLNANSTIDKEITLFQHKMTTLKSLVKLQAEIAKKKEFQEVYQASLDVWAKQLKLASSLFSTARIIIIDNNDRDYSPQARNLEFTWDNPLRSLEKKVEVLNKSLENAANVVKNPQDIKAQENLLISSKKLRQEIQGPYLLRKENRAAAALVSALLVLAAAASLTAAILTLTYISCHFPPIAPFVGYFVAVKLGGAFLFSGLFTSALMIAMAAFKPQGAKILETKQLAGQAAQSLEGFSSITKTKATLFAGAGAKPQAMADGPKIANDIMLPKAGALG